MDKLIKAGKDFANFVSLYPGYCSIMFLIGFALGALHQYYGL